jgi:putative chitinase
MLSIARFPIDIARKFKRFFADHIATKEKKSVEVSVQFLRQLGSRCKLVLLDLYIGPLNEAMKEFDINTPERVSMFLAQLFHESGGLLYMEEIASGAAYDNRKDLGNTDPEAIRIAKENGTTPGRFYKGHGPIQLTGYFNHKKYGQLLGVDLVNHPQLAATAEVGFRVAGLYWKLNGLNELADKGLFKTITRRINGGLNGYTDRLRYLGKARKLLGLDK